MIYDALILVGVFLAGYMAGWVVGYYGSSHTADVGFEARGRRLLAAGLARTNRQEFKQ